MPREVERPLRIGTAGRCEIRLSGSGGQGVILAATLLAEAAVASGREVVATQSYGPEARGGASQAAVIISDVEIDYPEVDAADLTVCLSQPAFDKFASQTRRDGLVLFDSGQVDAAGRGARRLGLPLVETAEREAGTPLAANVVAVGAVAGLVPALLGLQAVAECVRRRVPEKVVEANLRALAAGVALVEAALGR